MFDFLKYRFFYFLFSAIVISVGLFSIYRFGYRYSIDFIGGTNLEYQLDKKVQEKQLSDFLKEKKISPVFQKIVDKKIILKLKPISQKEEEELKIALAKKFNSKLTVLKSETVGPVLGKETIRKTIIASILAIFGILLYLKFAFRDFDYALSAILAMIHDFLVVFGLYSLISYFYRAEVDTMFITSILTTMSFSVHDTIVIFDKIREYFQKEGKADIDYFANKALSETMVRSINNSATIIFMLLSLILMGGETIRFFVISLLIGTVTGTYSSPFVATPILVWFKKRKK